MEVFKRLRNEEADYNKKLLEFNFMDKKKILLMMNLS